MNTLLRLALCGLLLAPAFAHAQSTYPRCNSARPNTTAASGPIVSPYTGNWDVQWPHGNLGCREALPEEPPSANRAPDPSTVPAELVEVGIEPPTEAAPIWMDFDPTRVPTYAGVIDVGIDLRSLPTALSTGGVDTARPRAMVLLEYAFQSISLGEQVQHDVFVVRAEVVDGDTALVVEHRRSGNKVWSSALDSDNSVVLGSRAFTINAPGFMANTAIIHIERAGRDVTVSANFTDSINFQLASPNATALRVRRGMFGLKHVTTADVLRLHWFEPDFTDVAANSKN